MDQTDAVIIGSGINGLVAAALLSRAGWKVVVCERNDEPGGAIRTRSDVFEGYTVETLSSWHPLFVGGPAYAALKDDLAAHGLVYANTTRPTGVATPDGTLVISTEPEVARAEFERFGDGAAWEAMLADFGGRIDLAFGLLGTDFWRPKSASLGWSAFRRLGRQGLLTAGAEMLEPATPWLERTFSSEVSRAALAPWALHNGLGPDDASSAFITKVIGAAVAMGGMPVPVGGGIALVRALVAIIESHGGSVITGADVKGIDTTSSAQGTRATGVQLADGRRITARRAVVASTTPRALYHDLLPREVVADDRHTAAAAYRHGRAAMQIHLALSAPARWADSRLDDVALVHVLDGVDSLSEAVNQAWRGLLPARPTVAVGQPLTMDPSRAPEGRGLLWLQLQELPRELRGDAAGTIASAADGWSDEVVQAYADRVIDRVAQHVPGLRDLITDRLVLGPRELEGLNANLVGGDPYGGDCRVDQYVVWRPLTTATGHDTGVRGLYQIGASTHPGPGLGGGSGYLVADRLLAMQDSPMTKMVKRVTRR